MRCINCICCCKCIYPKRCYFTIELIPALTNLCTYAWSVTPSQQIHHDILNQMLDLQRIQMHFHLLDRYEVSYLHLPELQMFYQKLYQQQIMVFQILEDSGCYSNISTTTNCFNWISSSRNKCMNILITWSRCTNINSECICSSISDC